VSAEPFHSTVEPTKKPEPFAVTLKAGPPAVAELGERLESDGVEAAEVTTRLAYAK
jgi:hypothetical protein